MTALRMKCPRQPHADALINPAASFGPQFPQHLHRGSSRYPLFPFETQHTSHHIHHAGKFIESYPYSYPFYVRYSIYHR